MAYIALDSGKWGSGPQIPISFYYEYQRSGTSMQYKVKIVFGAITGSSYFGYPIYVDLSLDGTKKVAQYTAKSASPSQWSSAITYESGWLTVANKTEGTTALTIRLYSGSGSSRDTYYKYSLAVSPAATTPTFSATTVMMGEKVIINLPRAVSSYTHTVAYTFGAIGPEAIIIGATESVEWTPPASLSKQIPNATSGACTITVQTYSGSTYIGSKTATITLVVPDYVVPTIQSVTPTEAVEGLADKFECYVQGKSKLSVSIDASDTYDAEIKSYVTIFDGATYNGSSFTTNTISGSGNLKMVTTVTDARGRTATMTQTIAVVAYTPPQITAMSAYRIDTSGNEDDNGERIAVNVSYAVASVNSKNTRLYSVRYKASSGSYTDIVTSQTAETSYSGTLTYTSSPVISGDSAWVVQFELSDYFTTISVTSEIPTAYTIIDFGKSGKGVAFGKVSAKDGLEFAMDVYMCNLTEATGSVLTIDSNGKVNKRAAIYDAPYGSAIMG